MREVGGQRRKVCEWVSWSLGASNELMSLLGRLWLMQKKEENEGRGYTG